MNIAICDDDIKMLSGEKIQIEQAVLQCGEECEIDVFTDPKDLTASLKKFDLYFLDVEMGQSNGIETAEALHKKNPGCLIFFVTNYESYMDEALNQHAFRFWTKPMDAKRLKYGIESAIKELQSRQRFLKTTVNKRTVNILLKDIIFAYTENRITKIVTVNGEVETKDLFKNIREQLNAEYFCEVHASYYINMNYVVSYNSDVVTCRYRDKSYDIRMSKRKATGFPKKFARWSGGTV